MLLGKQDIKQTCFINPLGNNLYKYILLYLVLYFLFKKINKFLILGKILYLK